MEKLNLNFKFFFYQRFCETKPASIRCKLADIRPPKNSSEWSQKAQETMDTLYSKNIFLFTIQKWKILSYLEQEDPLFVKIISIEEFEPSSGRFETIYGVDLIYGEESITSYFIQNGLAIQVFLFSILLLFILAPQLVPKFFYKINKNTNTYFNFNCKYVITLLYRLKLIVFFFIYFKKINKI